MIRTTVLHSAWTLTNRLIHRSSAIGSFVSLDFVVKEEVLDLVALQESTRSVDIKNALDSIMKTFDVPLNKLVSIATDGALAMLDFLEELKDEELSNDINLFRIVRWLSSYDALNLLVDLFDLITAFLKEKEITYSALEDDEW
ncbi:hypothetical protein TNCT_49761 [Trichonephila clavata]|uniref:Uncharacterized protein n=1 Tax=Trichonephila clavata TaxID=2740835 RepID=A0A8X6EX07_TRICU|nr:hypothetical protein TNCT_49761 [Trichonephila clavata]